MRKIILAVSALVFACNTNDHSLSEFKTYYIETAAHEITFYEHYIFDTSKISRSDSAAIIRKFFTYVDTVKVGKPIISVSVVDDISSFPQIPDDIKWSAVRKSTTLSVRFFEDSLKRNKYKIQKVYFKSRE